MRFSTATIVAFISMSNALPAPYYGTDNAPLPATTASFAGGYVPTVTKTAPYQNGQGAQPTAPVYGSGGAVAESSTIPVANPTYGDSTQAPKSPVQPSASAPKGAPKPSGGAELGSGGNVNAGGRLDLGGIVSGLLNGGKSPGLQVNISGGLDVEGVLGGLTDLLKGSGHLDGSGNLDMGGLLDSLKGGLEGLPGGPQLGVFCDQFKVTLSGSGSIDLEGFASGLESLLKGSGKLDFGATLGIDVDNLIDGLTLLLEASVSGHEGLDIGALLEKFEAFISSSGRINLKIGRGRELAVAISQLKSLLVGTKGNVVLDVKGVLVALKGLLSGSLNVNGFIAALAKLRGGQLLVTVCGTLVTIFKELGLDLYLIVSQLVVLLGDIAAGTLRLAGSIVSGTVLSLGTLLSAIGQVSGKTVSGIGGTVAHLGSSLHGLFRSSL